MYGLKYRRKNCNKKIRNYSVFELFARRSTEKEIFHSSDLVWIYSLTVLKLSALVLFEFSFGTFCSQLNFCSVNVIILRSENQKICGLPNSVKKN